MGEAKRNRYTKEFKFKVAISAIKGEKQLSEIAAEFKVHQTLISSWKRQVMEQGAVPENRPSKAEADAEATQEDMVKTIGHQAIQIDWLKKSSVSPSRGEACRESDKTISKHALVILGRLRGPFLWSLGSPFVRVRDSASS